MKRMKKIIRKIMLGASLFCGLQSMQAMSNQDINNFTFKIGLPGICFVTCMYAASKNYVGTTFMAYSAGAMLGLNFDVKHFDKISRKKSVALLSVSFAAIAISMALDSGYLKIGKFF